MVKVVAISCLLVVSLQSAFAWTAPVNALQKAAVAASIAVAIATAPLAASAVDFTGSYADPKHPNCLREVVVVGGNKAEVSGTDGTPACPADGAGRAWNLVGKVDGDNILVDFTPKGGPKDLQGLWEAQPVPGIRWPDGNLWSVKSAIQ